MRVRFPSPAPTEHPQLSFLLPRLALIISAPCPAGGPQNGPQTGLSDVLIGQVGTIRSHPVREPAQRLLDGLVAVSCGVLVDHHSPCARMPEPGHQLIDAGSGRGVAPQRRQSPDNQYPYLYLTAPTCADSSIWTAGGATKGGEFTSSFFSLIKELQCLVEVPFGDFLHELAIREVTIEQAQRSRCQ
jgi:hypothetical protein